MTGTSRRGYRGRGGADAVYICSCGSSLGVLGRQWAAELLQVVRLVLKTDMSKLLRAGEELLRCAGEEMLLCTGWNLLSPCHDSYVAFCSVGGHILSPCRRHIYRIKSGAVRFPGYLNSYLKSYPTLCSYRPDGQAHALQHLDWQGVNWIHSLEPLLSHTTNAASQ